MRSLLFVPAVEKMLKKIPELTADAFIIDLEDSIPPDKKEEALQLLKAFLSDTQKTIFVRLDGNLIEHEIDELKNSHISGFMIPKFESPDQYAELLDRFCGFQIIALVETPLGIINIQDIAACKWVNAIAFGAEDYTSSVGMANNASCLAPVRSRLVMYAKAFRKPVYDTPSFILNDAEALEAEVQYAQDMGFDGKMAINPKHISIIDRVFKSCDFDYIKSVIERYESSEEAVVVIDGKVYEKMHINHLKKILKENS